MFIGLVLFVTISLIVFGAAQAAFLRHTGRLFWRAMLPLAWRRAMLPNDEVTLDEFGRLEEWTALLMAMAFLTLPFIALNFIGFLNILPG
ncbi:MAG TPA: hypothetical protein PKO06_14005 [Candidatus Ozemobacteraceae bacterium]|mgnify:CR=1 FL=1|nr:hypothetical protein [Candidatus Ozemobacteraceae bacterium]